MRTQKPQKVMMTGNLADNQNGYFPNKSLSVTATSTCSVAEKLAHFKLGSKETGHDNLT